MKLPHQHDKSHDSYMQEDLEALNKCDGIYFLNNFMDSKGAMIEYYHAKTLMLPMIFENTTIEKTIERVKLSMEKLNIKLRLK